MNHFFRTILLSTFLALTHGAFGSLQVDSLERIVKQRLDQGLFDKETITALKNLHNDQALRDPLKASTYLEKAMEIAMTLGDDFELATIYSYYGNNYRSLGLFSKGLEAHMQALELAQKIGDDTMGAYTMNDMGNIYFDMKDYAKALQLYRRADRVCQATNYLKGMAVSQNNIGLVYNKLGFYDSALVYHQNALELHIVVKDPFLIAHSHIYLSEDHYMLGEYGKSMNSLLEAEKLLHKTPHRDRLSIIARRKGDVYLAMGRSDSAIAFYNQALDIARSLENYPLLVNNAVHLGGVYTEMGSYYPADTLLHMALKISADNGLLTKEISTYEALVDLYQKQRKFENAFHVLKNLNNLREEFNRNELTQKVSIIESDNNMRKKEKELLVSQRENELKAQALQAIKSKNIYLFGIMAILMIVAVMVLLAFYQKAKTNRELLAKNKIIQKQKSEIEAQNELLRSGKQSAEAFSEAKSAFVSSLSHEIRTPMSSILGLAELVLQKGNLDPESEKNMQSILTSADYLLHILNDVLDFSRIEAGKITFEEKDFNLQNLAKQLHEANKGKLTSQVLLSLNIDPEVPVNLKGDPIRLMQVLNNLIDNSVKFTETGFIRLDISAGKRINGGMEIIFRVEDTGMGMTKVQLKKAFEPFEQAGTDIFRQFGGSGLGLSIVKRFIELQGGSLKVDSTPGTGSTFTVLLPFKEGQEQGRKEPTPEGGEQNKLKGLNMLYVEDNEINRFVVEQILQQWGTNLDMAVDGSDAVTKAGEKQYDLVLMDIQMPVMDGIEATRQLRAMDNGKIYTKTPIIGFTADVMDGTRKNALEAGMNEVLLKPLNKDELYKVLSQYV